MNFTVVEPSAVKIEQEIGTGIFHIKGIPTVGFKGRPYILPDDVSFHNIEIWEDHVPAVANGYFFYQNGADHIPAPCCASVGSVIAEKGSMVDAIDLIQGVSDNHIPYENGSFTWDIPWYYKIGSGGGKKFTTVTQVKRIDPAGTLSISKGGTTISKGLNDPDSNY